MSENIQEMIQAVSKKHADGRVNVFSVDVKSLEDSHLTLVGRVLETANLSAVIEAISKQIPSLQVDVSGVRVLRQPGNPVLAVGTNLTSLHRSPSFLAEMDNQLVFGEKVEILEEQGRWVYVRQMDGYLGWTYKPYLTDAAIPAPTHVVLAPAVELRAEADAHSAVLSRILCGTLVKIQTTQGEWAQITANVTGWILLTDLRALDTMPKTEEARRQQMALDAQRMIGVPYLWGGTTGNGIDCSGFARLLHHWIGIELPRDADMQSDESKHVEPPYQPGDLFFFSEESDRHITHVGVCMGGMKVMHSSRARNGVYLDDLEKRESLRSILVHAGTFVGK